MAIIGEKLKDYVITQIQQRQQTHGDGFSLPGQNIKQNSDYRSEQNIVLLNANNSWIKLASGVKVTGKKLQNLGVPAFLQANLSGSGLAKANVLFGGLSTYSNGILTPATEFLGERYQASGEWGIVPMPGIESIEIKSLTRGSLKKATVKLVAQTRDQLAILDVLYLRLGYSVLLEWGNSFYKKFDSTVLNDPKEEGDERVTIEQMGQTIIDNEDQFFSTAFDKVSYITILPLIEKLREKHQGNYDALFGKISNFNWSFNNDGSYDIEITIISLGDVVESLKSNVIASHDTLSYVNANSLSYTNESSTLDKARKDNIILSLLHVFKLLNHTTFTSNPYCTIETKNDSGVKQPDAKPFRLLNAGGDTITTSEYVLTYKGEIRIIPSPLFGINHPSGPFSPEKLDPKYFKKLWVNDKFKYAYDSEIKTKNRSQIVNGLLVSSTTAKEAYVFTGGDLTMPPNSLYITSANGIETTLEFKDNIYSLKINSTRKFSQAEYDLWLADRTSPSAIKDWNDVLNTAYAASPIDINYSFTYPPGSSQAGTTVKFKDLFAFPDKANNLPAGFTIVQDTASSIVAPDTNSTVTIKNPLKNTGYLPEDNNPQMTLDAFVLTLDVPEYYMRFGYLLNLVEQKVVTRIDQGLSHNDNPNLFKIDWDNAPMTCLPNQISFDWRKCIVARNNFNAGWQMSILPQLNSTQWVKGTSQVANAMNIYLNFEFIAESLTSNLDEKGNISVYNFIKSLCDGINTSLGGVNNLEPIIDEDTNTLNILDSTPNETVQPSGDYELKLYGYSKDNANNNTSTFVRKVDLKTAITPEYATMVTVGATAGGYVKGIEATAFARWNDGILDRFKEKLIAADKDIAATNSTDENTDTVASFEEAMNWTAKCFGIDGGLLWNIFPM
jgi:hypothetical protein